MRILTIFILAISIHLLHAQDTKTKEVSFVEKMRPTLERFLGTERTEMLIGKAPIEEIVDAVPMQKIPEIVENAKSIEVYSKKEDTVKLNPEVEQKYYVSFIREIYEATRKEKPTDDDIGKYYNVLSQGGTREGVYRSLVLDSTYANLENMDQYVVKSQAADFAVFFFTKYANRNYTKEKFKGWNAFAMKRLMTERSLEIFDTYGTNREAIEAWYANFSVDMATKFPSVMNTKLRKNTSATVHYQWAKKAPVQHIKSEMILKIHMAINSLL